MRFALVVLVLCATAVAGSAPTPRETHVVETGAAPCGTAARAGALWVGVYGTGGLLRLEPDSGRITRRISVGSWACRVAVGGNAAWVTRDRAGELVRIDLTTGRRQRIEAGGSPFDVILANGSAWVTSFDTGTVARINAATGRLERVHKDGSHPAGLALCGGRIWVGHGRDGTWLTSIDPATHRMRRVSVGTRSPGWPRCVRGELWVTAPETVLRVDPRSGAVTGRLRLGATLAEAAAAPDGFVWVTDKERSLVYRVDPERFVLVDSFAAGPGAYSLVRVKGAMWVTSFAGGDVRSYTP